MALPGAPHEGPLVTLGSSRTEVYDQALVSEEVQPQQSIHGGARRERVSEERKASSLLSKGDNLTDRHSRNEFHPASGCNLDPFRLKGRIVADQHQHSDVNNRAGCTCVECKLQDDAVPEARQAGQ